MKSILTKIHILSFLCALPALANDVGLHNSSAQPTRATQADPIGLDHIYLNTQMVMAQVADNHNVNQNFDYILKTCQEVPSGLSAGSAQSVVYPRSMLSMYLKNHYNREIDIRLISNKLIETPKHGEIKDVYDPSMKRSFLEYVPFVVGDRYGNEGYEGKDRAVYLLEFESKRYKLIINFVVTPSGAIDGEPSLCPADKLIKLN